MFYPFGNAGVLANNGSASSPTLNCFELQHTGTLTGFKIVNPVPPAVAGSNLSAQPCERCREAVGFGTSRKPTVRPGVWAASDCRPKSRAESATECSRYLASSSSITCVTVNWACRGSDSRSADRTAPGGQEDTWRRKDNQRTLLGLDDATETVLDPIRCCGLFPGESTVSPDGIGGGISSGLGPAPQPGGD